MHTQNQSKKIKKFGKQQQGRDIDGSVSGGRERGGVRQRAGGKYFEIPKKNDNNNKIEQHQTQRNKIEDHKENEKTTRNGLNLRYPRLMKYNLSSKYIFSIYLAIDK